MSVASLTPQITGTIYMGLNLNPNGSKLFQTTNSVPWIKKTVSNGSRIHCMKVLFIITCKIFGVFDLDIELNDLLV